MWVGFWKAEAKKVPYKHPWRDEKGSYRARKGADPGTSGRNYRDSASSTSAGRSRDSASPESSCHRFLGYSGFSEASSIDTRSYRTVARRLLSIRTTVRLTRHCCAS